MTSTILYPLGVRLSTWLATAAFIYLATKQHNTRPIVAAAAWLAGFEAAYQIPALILHRTPVGTAGPTFLIIFGVTVVAIATHQHINPNPRLLAAALTILATWALLGLHANAHQHGLFTLTTPMAGFNLSDEILNETAKTLWALAYLMPLWITKPRLRSESNLGSPLSRQT